MDLVAGVQEDAEERVGEASGDDLVQGAADLADAHGAVPLGDGLEIGADEARHVVADRLGQLRRLFDDEARTAVEPSPDPERDRERVAALDRPVARAEQPESGPWPGRQHRVAGERGAVPAEQRDRLALGHARTQAAQHVAHPAGRARRRVLEDGELVDVVDDAQAIGGVDEEVGRVLDGAARAGRPAQLVDQVRRQVAGRSVRIRLPADDPYPGSIPDPLLTEDLRERPRTIPWLAGEAEVLEAMPPHRQGRRAGRAPAFVPDEDRRLPLRPDDEQRLLEPWIEPRQEREVGAVLPIGVDHESVEPALLRAGTDPFDSLRVQLGRDLGRRARCPEVRQGHVGHAGLADLAHRGGLPLVMVSTARPRPRRGRCARSRWRPRPATDRLRRPAR